MRLTLCRLCESDLVLVRHNGQIVSTVYLCFFVSAEQLFRRLSAGQTVEIEVTMRVEESEL